MFPDNRTLMKALKVLLSSNNFYTAIYMCACKPKNEASITFALTTKASRNRTMLHKEFFFFSKMRESYQLVFSHSFNQGERSQAKCSFNIYGYPWTFLLNKGEINKRRKKYHTAFSFPTIIFKFSLEKCQPITNQNHILCYPNGKYTNAFKNKC